MNILEKIAADKKKEVASLKESFSIDELSQMPYFEHECFSASTLIKKGSGVIAEFKRKSPSKGWISEKASATEIAKAYFEADASCISVLTDEKYFGGSVQDLVEVRRKVEIPILRKEFIVDPYQIFEAKAIGADFILLIAEILSAEQVKDFSSKAKELGMETLLEMHSEKQLSKICDTLDLVGINNRNLETFEVDLDRSIELLDKIPKRFVRVAESGISNPKEVVKLKKAGFDAFLIGENFMKTAKPGKALKDFIEEINSH